MRIPTIREKIPDYLHEYIATQNPALYTAIDHASWRYIMRVSRAFFPKHAHEKYLNGLKETGIALERIPLISEMDAKLQAFGWRAVPVVGFIPPAVFMEFLSIGVLPIACDMRTLEHLSYTPAPDIVHEAAGHAPFIADPEYADYLFAYGESAGKVIYSRQDMELYEAIRKLSDVKEDPGSSPELIAQTQARLEEVVSQIAYASEATKLARMGWWTFEYGLVGSLEAPKIYGAGLLSSIGESYHCLGPEVRKLPFSIDCVEMSYDITRPQPQLYVTPNFTRLREVLEQFASTLSYRRGGAAGLAEALRAGTVVTAELDSGVQASGIVVETIADRLGEPAYLRFQGPCQLSCGGVELEGQGAAYHREGFGTPVGRLKGLGKSAAEVSEEELTRLNGVLEFESGVVVRGKLSGKIRSQGLNLVLVFKECTVKLGDRVLFDPSWGTFDMACGARVVSVFGGAADRSRYLEATGGFRQAPGNPKTNLTEKNKSLNALYARVREARESGKVDRAELERVLKELERHHPDDWLLRLELLELDSGAEKTLRPRLLALAAKDKTVGEMIHRGLELLK